jgi:dolichyl-diphosphooligosaccharide--protein glycosyltransferase
MKEVGITTVWPNVFTTVAEQNSASLNSVISQIGFGNWFLFLIGISGLILSTIKKKDVKTWFVVSSVVWYALVILAKPQNLRIFIVLVAIPVIARFIISIKENEKGIDAKYAILLSLWILSTIYASVKGVRFTLLLVPAFAVSFGITVGLVYTYLSRWISKELNIHKTITRVSIILLMCLLLIAPFKSAASTAKNEIPSMNDAWWSSLEEIRLESEPDAIINSWWDFGHWFKYIADRPVTFDGTSQNSPQAHWIGNSLLTDDEDIAIGILRMLDCGANNAFEELNKVIEDTPEAVDIIYEVIVLDKANAKKTLKDNGLSSEEAESVLQYTHCEPPEDYFITSEDMVGKAGVWSHFGNWDFDRALMYNTLKRREYNDDRDKSVEFLQERFNMSMEDAENVYYEIESIKDSSEANSWIAEWPNYYGIQGCNKEDNNTLACGFVQGLVVSIDLGTMDATISTQQGVVHPDVLVYPTETGIIRKDFLNDTLAGIGLTLIPSGDNYVALISHTKLAAGMFTRLFYMEGHGLKHFEKFSDKRGVTGGRIIVWKVNWQGNATNILDEFKEPEEIKKEEIEQITSDETEADSVSNLSSDES